MPIFLSYFLILIFLQRERLESRGSETESSLKKRMDSATEALEYGTLLINL